MDAIAAIPKYNAGSPFDQLPLKNYISGSVQNANLVNIISVVVIPVLEISRPSAGSIRLQITGAPSAEYQVHFSPSLLANSFSPLVTLTTNGSGIATYDDVTSAPMKFYKVGIP